MDDGGERAVLREAVARGDLGDLAVLRLTRSAPHPALAPRHEGADPEEELLRDLAQDVDVALGLAGPVTSVCAVSTQSAAGAAEPAAAAHVLLTHASGAITQLSGFWGPAHLTSTTSFSVTGTEGTLEHSSAAERALVADLGPTAGELATAPRGPAEQRSGARASAEAVRVTSAAAEAARTGATIHLTRSTTTEAR